jgi:hypothetical protein
VSISSNSGNQHNKNYIFCIHVVDCLPSVLSPVDCGSQFYFDWVTTLHTIGGTALSTFRMVRYVASLMSDMLDDVYGESEGE